MSPDTASRSAFTSITQTTSYASTSGAGVPLKTFVTSATSSHPLPKLSTILSTPRTLITLNPFVVDVSGPSDRGSGSSETYTVTDRITFLGCINFKTTYTATFSYHDGRPEPTVETKVDLGVRTRSVWHVEEDTDGRCSVQEIFELVKAPWGFRWYILRTAKSGHRVLFEKMGEALEGM